jgi:hypothetical protein
VRYGPCSLHGRAGVGDSARAKSFRVVQPRGKQRAANDGTCSGHKNTGVRPAQFAHEAFECFCGHGVDKGNVRKVEYECAVVPSVFHEGGADGRFRPKRRKRDAPFTDVPSLAQTLCRGVNGFIIFAKAR